MIKDIILKNRSYRKFDEKVPVARQTLLELIELARLSASGGNLQPLKYFLSYEKEKNDMIFPFLAWAGYLHDWPGPKDGERPSAYILILGDTQISKNFGCDHGIAAQSILLGAVEKGLGGCMIGSVDREKLRKRLNIKNEFEILLAIALGKPTENIKIDTVKQARDIKYWRDNKDIHHVPKRSLEDIIVD